MKALREAHRIAGKRNNGKSFTNALNKVINVQVDKLAPLRNQIDKFLSEGRVEHFSAGAIQVLLDDTAGRGLNLNAVQAVRSLETSRLKGHKGLFVFFALPV